MARMKVEVAFQKRKTKALTLGERMTAFLPRQAPRLSKLGWLLGLRDKIPGAAKLSEKLTGFSAKRTLPAWAPNPFREQFGGTPVGDGKDVVLFADTFTTWFEPEKPRAAAKVLKAAGYHVHVVRGDDGRGPCCGRTFLSAGLVDEARAEALRSLDLFEPFLDVGAPILGLEPACLFSFKDEFEALGLDARAEKLAASARLIDEFIATDAAETLGPLLKPVATTALVHGHCHQKAFGAAEATLSALRLIPDMQASMVESSCCGMAGSFGYESENYDVSIAMAEI
ncbi:MAG: (Fe-S)-binding protein, partial [Alphaproteobacteria bacterium]